MVRSVLYLQPASGGLAAIERFFAQEGVLERSARMRGFIGGELHRPDNEDGPALVTALWERREDYRTWVEDPWRVESAARAAAVLAPMGDADGGGLLYEVMIAVGSATPGVSDKSKP